jgi:hypothetical protein
MLWRQILADLFQADVATLSTTKEPRSAPHFWRGRGAACSRASRGRARLRSPSPTQRRQTPSGCVHMNASIEYTGYKQQWTSEL